MSNRPLEPLLYGYRPGGPNEPAIEKAAKHAEVQPEAARSLQGQATFDDSMRRLIGALTPPEDLRQRLNPNTAGKPEKLPLGNPAVVAAIFGVIILLGLVVMFVVDRQTKFSGREAVERIIASANELEGDELDRVSTTAGQLGDTFMLKGFDMYAVPPEFAAAPALGVRVFKQNGAPIAQVAVEWHQSLLYVFRPQDLGVELPSGNDWRYLQVGEWATALRRHGNVGVAVAIRGDDNEMREFMESLPQPPRP